MKEEILVGGYDLMFSGLDPVVHFRSELRPGGHSWCFSHSFYSLSFMMLYNPACCRVDRSHTEGLSLMLCLSRAINSSIRACLHIGKHLHICVFVWQTALPKAAYVFLLQCFSKYSLGSRHIPDGTKYLD